MTADGSKINRYTVPGLERGLTILAAFTRAAPEWGAPELSVKLGMPRSTVFRLLQTLESMGYLVRAEDSHRYRLGIAVLRMGFEYLASQGVVELGRPLIERLSLDVGLSAHLVVCDGRSIIYVVCAKPRSAFAGTVTVGTRLPTHATVFGRVLLGGRSLPDLCAIFPAGRLPSTTGQTPDTIEDLYALVQRDYERGFGVSEGFYEPDISTIAVPVRDQRDDIVAAVGLTITKAKVDHGLIDDGVLDKVVDTAAALSEHLGYRGHAYVHAHAHAAAMRRREAVE